MTKKYRWGWMNSFDILSYPHHHLLVSDRTVTSITLLKLDEIPQITAITRWAFYPVLKFCLVGAARTRAPAATNYDVHAPRRKMLGSPAPKCNGAGSPRPSAILTTDRPRPGKYVDRVVLSILYFFISGVAPKFMGQFLRPFVSSLRADLLGRSAS